MQNASFCLFFVLTVSSVRELLFKSIFDFQIETLNLSNSARLAKSSSPGHKPQARKGIVARISNGEIHGVKGQNQLD